jgi:amino acid transporter
MTPPLTLKRSLRYVDLVVYGLAYIAPYALLSTLGYVWKASNGLIVLAYFLGAVCMYFTAKSYAVMSEAVPQAGSVYGFARHALGRLPGFVAGWMILLDYLLVPAFLYLIVAVAATELMPSLGRGNAVVLLAAVTLTINWFGITVSNRVNFFSVGVQTIVIGGMMILGVVALAHGFGTGGLTLAPIWNSTAFSAGGMANATSLCIMSFLGFDAISTLSEEVVGDDRSVVGRAIVNSLLIAALFFAAGSFVLGNLLPGIAVRDPAAAGYELATAAFGAWATGVIAWTNVGIVGMANSLPMQVGVARVLFAMGRDRQLPHVLSRVHAKHGTPWVSMLVASAISTGVALAMQDRIDDLTNIVNFGALSAFLMLHVSVIVAFGIRQRSKRWVVHWATPILGACVVLIVLRGMSPVAAIVGLAWLGAGVAWGLTLQARERPEAPLRL